MATVTPNFNWPVPTSTDLVKDGATAIEALGDSIDASLVDLKGGTTGQVLSKTSGTDMDFTWVTTDDANAIQNSIVDAKGDLISATANDTPARLAVGANGETLVADSSQTTGLVWAGNFAAGKNKIINGDMRISQRGTSFTIASPTTYTLDRYFYDIASAVPTGTVSQQTFTPGTAPIAGYEAANFLRVNSTANNGCSAFQLIQRIEDVRTFAGQTVTFSFFAKADATSTFAAPAVQQVFGSGGSGTVTTAITMNSTSLGTGWARYTGTVAVPSISGKTIGTSSYLQVVVSLPTAAGVFRNGTYDYWGWQLEAGSVATAFQTATGTIQGELAACQRYYWRNTTGSTYGAVASAYVGTTTQVNGLFNFPVQMRVTPTAVEQGNLEYIDFSGGSGALSSPSYSASESTPLTARVNFTVSGATAGRGAFIRASNNTAAYIGFTSEL